MPWVSCSFPFKSRFRRRQTGSISSSNASGRRLLRMSRSEEAEGWFARGFSGRTAPGRRLRTGADPRLCDEEPADPKHPTRGPGFQNAEGPAATRGFRHRGFCDLDPIGAHPNAPSPAPPFQFEPVMLSVLSILFILPSCPFHHPVRCPISALQKPTARGQSPARCTPPLIPAAADSSARWSEVHCCIQRSSRI